MRLFEMHDFSCVYVFLVRPGYMVLELETNLDTLKCFGIVYTKDVFLQLVCLSDVVNKNITCLINAYQNM